MISNILKVHSYFYDYDQLCWQKRIHRDNFQEEELFVYEYKDQADFVILSDNRFVITPAYKLSVETYSYNHSNLLKALSYQYIPNKHTWFKAIFAKNLTQEMINIKDCPHQKIFVSRNKH